MIYRASFKKLIKAKCFKFIAIKHLKKLKSFNFLAALFLHILEAIRILYENKKTLKYVLYYYSCKNETFTYARVKQKLLIKLKVFFIKIFTFKDFFSLFLKGNSDF